MVKRVLSVIGLMAVFMGIAVSCPFTSGAVTWGYPPEADLPGCLDERNWWPYSYIPPGQIEYFPDKESAREKAIADCNEFPTCYYYLESTHQWYKQSTCYYWEWGGNDTAQCLNVSPGTCLSYECCGVLMGGFTSYCPHTYPNPHFYVYHQRDCVSSYPPPSQVEDPPITTQITDKNTGGPCEGNCDTFIDGRGKK